jgi:peptidoglycan hydrolase CwlO-like protein
MAHPLSTGYLMSAGGEPPPPAPSTLGSPLGHRESRWRGQGYADITKLREIAAKHDRISTRHQQRASRLQVRMEKLRHHATVIREKSQTTLARIPEVEQEIAQYDRDIKASTSRTHGIQVGSDVTNLQYRIRKLQQKVVNLQHKSRGYELSAARKTQKSAELKIKADHFLEMSKLEEQEARAYRDRADRLQLATEGQLTGSMPGPPNATRDGSGPT